MEKAIIWHPNSEPLKKNVMDQKKHKSADLEKRRNTFFLIGVLISLSFALIAFEWTGNGRGNFTAIADMGAIELEPDIINTYTKPEKKPVPPKPLPKEKFIMVDDQSYLPEEYIPFDTDISQNDSVPFMNYLPDETDGSNEEIFVIVEDMPGFQGGDINGFVAYLSSRLKYPEAAVKAGIEGTIVLSFIVDEHGELGMIELVRKLNPDIDSEAIRVLKESPRWEPGRQRGKAVKVKFFLPLKFELK